MRLANNSVNVYRCMTKLLSVFGNQHMTVWKFVSGISLSTEADENNVTVYGLLLDITLDSPAKALWLQMKQFNGYFGCPKCKERGQQHVIGIGKGGRKRQCHIYPYNGTFSSGHCEERCHSQVKKQALQALKNRRDGMKSVRFDHSRQVWCDTDCISLTVGT